MCGCHNRGNKDKCGSSPTATSHKPLVMHNSSHSSIYTGICTHTGRIVVERLNDHTEFDFMLCFHSKQTHREQNVVGAPWLEAIAR